MNLEIFIDLHNVCQERLAFDIFLTERLTGRVNVLNSGSVLNTGNRSLNTIMGRFEAYFRYLVHFRNLVHLP